MIGDLSMRPTGSASPVPSVRAALDGPTGPRAARPFSSAIDPGDVIRQSAAGRRDDVERLRAILTDPNTRIRTHHDEASGRTVIEIESLATGETVDQIPNDELLRLYAAIRRPLIDETA